MDDCELIALITAVACGISKCSSDDELAILGAAFAQLGDTLTTLSIQRDIRDKRANGKKSNEDKANENHANENQARENKVNENPADNPDNQPLKDNQADEYNPDHYPFDGYDDFLGTAQDV